MSKEDTAREMIIEKAAELFNRQGVAADLRPCLPQRFNIKRKSLDRDYQGDETLGAAGIGIYPGIDHFFACIGQDSGGWVFYMIGPKPGYPDQDRGFVPSGGLYVGSGINQAVDGFKAAGQAYHFRQGCGKGG